MAKSDAPVTIKCYANARLYNTAAAAYVTFEDLDAMIAEGHTFVVRDAETGADMTRLVLAKGPFEH